MESQFKIWLMAVRSKTLMASIAPVFIGTSMAFGDGVGHFLSAVMALLGALTIQIGTNLANDYYDYQKGADQPARIGPTRVTQAGLIKPQTVKLSFILSFVLTTLISIYLIYRGGWPILLIGILSIISGILYTAGPYPLGYIGLGEVFVLIFFGPVAVAGTYYVQSFEMNMAVVLAGLGPGLFSVAILTVNNLRDVESDAQSGKKTLAVRFGKTFAMREYVFAVIAACLVPLTVYGLTQDYTYSLFAAITAVFAVPTIVTVLTKSDGASLNHALASTGKLLFCYSLLFASGWIL